MQMGVLIEFVLDLLLEGMIEGAKSEKVPKRIRKILLLLISGFYIFLIGIFIYLGLRGTNRIIKGLFIGLVILFIFFLSKLWIQYYKVRK
jgi:hypothetical protein